MSLLHTLSAPSGSTACADCIRLLIAGDALLLMGDGVYVAIDQSGLMTQIIASGAKIYLLQDDALARGIGKPQSSLPMIDLAGFVDLTEKFPQQLAWY